jgi:hypothetical protein
MSIRFLLSLAQARRDSVEGSAAPYRAVPKISESNRQPIDPHKTPMPVVTAIASAPQKVFDRGFGRRMIRKDGDD